MKAIKEPLKRLRIIKQNKAVQLFAPPYSNTV